MTRYADAVRRHAAQLRDHILRPDDSTFHTFYWDAETGEPLRGAHRAGRARRLVLGARTGVGHLRVRPQPPRDRRSRGCSRPRARCARLLPGVTCPATACRSGISSTATAATPRATVRRRRSPCAGCSSSRRIEPDAGARRALRAGRRRASSPRSCRTTRRRAADDSDALLLHGVYDLPKDVGVDEGTLWGDYFYLEALMRAAVPDWRPYW